MPPMNGNGPILRERVHPALILYPVAHLAVEIYNSMVSIMWPLFRERFGLSFSAVGILTLIFRGSMTLPQMPFAALGDRRGTRWLGIGGLALMAVGMGLVGLAPSIPLLVLVLALAPLGSAAVHPAGTSHVSSVLTRSRGAAVAVFMIGGTIGGALGPLLGGWLYERHGLAASPWLTPLGLAIALAMFFWLPAQEHSPTRPAQPGPGQVRIPPAMYLLVAACMGVSWVENGLNSYLPLLYSGRGLPLMAASQALFAMTAASTGGILVGGLLSDRMPRWRIIVAAEALSVPLYAGTLLLGGPWALLAPAALGFASALSHPTGVALGQELMPDQPSLAAALTMGFSWVLGSFGVLLTGVLADRIGMQTALLLNTGVPVVGMACMLTLYALEKRRKAAARLPLLP